MSKISQYIIELEKYEYFPGETVKGSLKLRTIEDIQCRGIRIELKGEGRCRFKSGDDYEDNSMVYAKERITVWGNLYKTPVIDGAGANAIFNPPWSPNEGVLLIPVPRDGSQQLIMRVMDYDWGRKDDLLGEILININDTIAKCQQTGKLTFPLYKGGEVGKGKVTFMIEWSEDPIVRTSIKVHENEPVVKVKVISATGLPKADIFGKNDVYVQGYVPDDVVSAMAMTLPTPEKLAVFQPQSVMIPFQFQLPNDLPSSNEVKSRNYVRYSIYSCFDIKWKSDPSTRCFFTVIQPIPNTLPGYTMLPYPSRRESKNVKPCPFLCCISIGEVSVQFTSSRNGGCGGETIPVHIQGQNTSSKDCSISINLLCHYELSTFGGSLHDFFSKEFAMTEAPLNLDAGQSINQTVNAVIPCVPPPYMGLKEKMSSWLEANPRGQWATAVAKHRDPIKWNYTLVVKVSVPGSFFDLKVESDGRFGVCGTKIEPVMESSSDTERVDPSYWNDYVALDSLHTEDYTFKTSVLQKSADKDVQEDYISYGDFSYIPQYTFQDYSTNHRDA